MRTAVPTARKRAAQRLTDSLTEHVDDDPALWCDLWQPPIPDALVAHRPYDAHSDGDAGEYTVMPGRAHWCDAKNHAPIVWLTLAERPSNGDVALIAETLDGRGRVVTIRTDPSDLVSAWVKTIPRPGE